MATAEIQVHTCDRCSAERQQPARADFPRDWSRVSHQQVQGGATERWELCHTCTAAFLTWIAVWTQDSSS